MIISNKNYHLGKLVNDPALLAVHVAAHIK